MKERIKGMTLYKQNILERVNELVCEQYAMPLKEIRTRNRALRYSIPRLVAIGILRNVFGFTYSSLTSYYNYASTCSVQWARKELDKRMAEDPEIASVVKEVLKQVKPLIPNH